MYRRSFTLLTTDNKDNYNIVQQNPSEIPRILCNPKILPLPHIQSQTNPFHTPYSKSLMIHYISDEKTTARGPDAARLEVLSGPRQILK